MSQRHFMDLYRARAAEGKAVCVGLDLDHGKFPARYARRPLDDQLLLEFAASIIEATADIAIAYKPNIAFYEAYGTVGMAALHQIIRFIHGTAPGVPIILDAKRADIDNTNLGYIRSAFEHLGADAITVHPYLGAEALQPFLDCADKGIIVLCRTSNKGAGEFQDSWVLIDDSEEHAFFEQIGYGMQPVVSVYQHVAYRVAQHWNKRGNCALVVGATYPAELAQVRRIVGDMPLLIPGIGAQGGDVEAAVRNGRDVNGQGMIINSSRGIIYAEDPRAEALRLDGLIRQFATA
ncbi:MAG: orotidine-5'-phosphate decarboxylase [Candidatus Moraniibacteriota bacterium]